MNKKTNPSAEPTPLRGGMRLGKYRLRRRIGSGGFANVYSAVDTLLGIDVAIKIPLAHHVSEELMAEFRNEVKVTMKMDHPNVLPIRDASFIDGHFVIVSPLADRTLSDRLQSRMSFERAFSFLEKLVGGVAHAHQQGIVHCDIKPENVLLFPDDSLRLTDFGIAKVAKATISGSGTGTLGYMAPEQAMGKPSTRSDVFSIGLIAYRMFAGKWPEYPFDWPMPGNDKLRKQCHPELIALIKKSLSMFPRHRQSDAIALETELKSVRAKAIRFSRRHRRQPS